MKNYNYSKCSLVDQNGMRNELCLNPQQAITKAQVIEYGTYKGRECSKLVVLNFVNLLEMNLF